MASGNLQKKKVMASGRAKAIVLVVALVRAIEFIYGNCKKICQALPGEQSFFLKKWRVSILQYI